MQSLFQLKYYLTVLLIMSATSVWGQTDFQLTVSPFGNPITLPAGGSPQMLTYTVTNNGPFPEGDQTIVSFFLNNQIEPVNVTSSDLNWNCIQVTSQIDCSYNTLFGVGFSSDLNLSLTSPISPTTVLSAVNASMTNALGDSNPGNESIISDIDFVTGAGVDLEILKSISSGFPAVVAPTDLLSFDLTVTNLSSVDAATNVVVIDDLLSNNLVFQAVGSSPACSNQGSLVQCDVPLLPMGSSVVLTIAAIVDSTALANNYINTATVTGDQVDFNFSNNSSDQPFVVTPGAFPEINVVKSIIGNPTGIPYGNTLTYRIEVNNTGGGDASNVDLTDTLPAGVTFQSLNPLGNFTCSYTAPTVLCNAVNLPVTAAVDGVEITVVVDGNVGDLINNIATSSFVDNNSLDNSSNVAFTVQTFDADLSATKVVNGSSSVNQGQPVEFTIGMVNNGPNDAYDVRLTDDIPSGLVFDSVVSENGISCTFVAGNNQIICDAPGLANGNSHTAVVRMIVNGTGLINNTVTASSTNVAHFDPFTSDLNQATAAITGVGVSADLAVLLNADSIIYSVGDAITMGLAINNPLGSTGTPPNVSVVTTLPNQLVFGSTQLVQAAGWSCVHDGSPTGGNLTCDSQGTPVPIGDNILIDILALADSSGTGLLTTATMTSDFDPNPSNDTTNTVIGINPADADLSLVFNSTSGIYNQGDSIVYDIRVDNPMGSSANPTDVTVDVTLPSEVSFSNANLAAAPGWFCSHDGSPTGGAIDCDRQGAAFVSFSTHDFSFEVVTVAPATNAIVQASINSTADSNLANNSSSQVDVINAPLVTTIVASKSAEIAATNVTEVAYGSLFDYVLKVDNTGANDAINVRISDSLPPEVTLMGFDTFGWTCLPLSTNAVGEVVDCTRNGPLNAGNNDQIVMNVMATTNTATSTITNQMTAMGDNTGTVVSDSSTVNLISSEGALLLTQNPSPIDPGDDVTFDILFTNTGVTTLTGVVIDAVLPQNFVYNGFTGDPGITCSENAGTVICSLANSMPPNNSLSVSLQQTTPTVLVNNQAYDLSVTADANELLNPVFQSLSTHFSASDIAVSLNSLVAQVEAGEPFEHRLQLRNSGHFDLANITANFAFPVHAELVGVETSEMNCQTINRRVICTNSNPLPIGSLLNVSFILTSNGSNNVVGTNVAVIADGVSKVATANTTILGTTFDYANDLSLMKSASVTQVAPQGAFSYLLDVTNNGLNEQSGFMVTDELPAGVVFQNVVGTNWSCVGTTALNCQFAGQLSSGSTTQLQLDVIAPNVNGLITNTAQVVLVQDQNLVNNQSSVNVEVSTGGDDTAVADIATQISSDVQEVISTESISWTIDISNNGPDEANNVRLQNIFPVGFLAEDVLVGNGVSCTLLTASLACEISTLGISQTVQIMLKGSFSIGYDGLLTNMVDVSSDAIDPDLTNNQGLTQINVISSESLNADLALEMVSNNQDISQGDVLELTLRSRNNGPDQAVETKLTANLSGLISQVQVMNSGQWVCQANSSSVSCIYPGSYTVGMLQDIDLLVTTQQVIQSSQPITVNAMIESSSMDPQPGNNMVGFTNEVSRTPTEGEIFDLFENAVGGAASETVMRTIRNVSSYCARSYFMAIEGLCEEMIASARPENGAAIINAMEEITPNEVVGQSTSASEMITSQFRNIDSRLSQLRGGGGAGISVAGLNGRYGNESIPLGMLAYLNQSEEEQQNVSNISDFVSPWGFFVNGTISMGERDATGRELGFDFDTYGLTAGVDYRFSSNKVAGVALGYANFDSEIEDEAEMKSTGFTLTGYGSFYIKDNFYVDGRISYGSPDFEQKRRINFDLDNISIDRVASGKTNANQYSVAMSMGYHFNKNAWNITPNASFRYVKTSIDAFEETGAGGFNFAIANQEVESMVWSVGTSISRAISLKNGIITPQFDINLSRETENDGGLLEARFITAPDDEIFYIETDEPDRTYGSAGVGLVFIGANGKQAYINYRSIFGLEGFTRGTINLGARFEF